tara:strand:+ start:7665 stop:8621 length:957 start_codon:yes stop_codon:yes gene_type:complete
MENKNARIYVASVANVTKRLVHYGDVKIENISLLKLIYKYSCYSSTYSQLQRLDKMVAHLQRVDPYICLERQAASTASYTAPVGIVNIGADGNNAPTLTSSAITANDSGDPYVFTYLDLFSGYSDDGSGNIGSFVVNSLPANGTLLYNGFEITIGTLLYDVTKLVYNRSVDDAYSTSFTYYAYDDDAQLPLPSNAVSCAITVEQITEDNNLPTIGNRNIYADNRTTTVLTLQDFTSLAVAAYNDIDGDPLQAVKVIEISEVNSGTYYYYGSVLTVGQIITADELSSGALYHIASDSNGIATDTLEVAIRDHEDSDWVN